MFKQLEAMLPGLTGCLIALTGHRKGGHLRLSFCVSSQMGASGHGSPLPFP